jgi:hypothetical protein
MASPGPEQPSVPAAEAAPSMPAAPQNAGQPAPIQQLTADEVAAAIAATSTPGEVPTSVPTPATAADQDLIEPEWVNKAEQVVKETEGNPYAEEEGVENLQVDYLKKRYGHEVKKTTEDQ